MAERRGSPGLRLLLLGAGLALAAGGVLLLRTAPESERAGEAGESAALPEVVAHRVASEELQPRARLAGVLEPRRSVALSAESPGRVIEIGAEELDRVEEGQVLVRLDPLLARVAVERAEAALARGRSELALARADLERRRSLARRDAASAAALDAAENGARVAASALREARAALEEARDQLGKKTIQAPFAGVLREFPVEVGEYLQHGQAIAELLDLSAARITVGLSDREIVAVQPGADVEVAVEAHAGETFRGAVLRVGAASDSRTKKFPVEVELPNPDGRLLPGMVARVTLDLGAPRRLTLIPREAALAEYGLRFVYVVERDGSEEPWVARRRRVEVRELTFQPGALEVLTGLEPGEEIVRSGLRRLQDGAPVRRRTERAP